MVISLLGTSKSIPARAKSYALWPLMCMAEYLGGICEIVPRKFGIIFFISSMVGIFDDVWYMSPSISPVVVDVPNSKLNSYVFSSPSR